MRIYVLVTSCDPLRVYLYEEGIARFCSKEYTPPDSDNAKDAYVHLTNWSINKKNQSCTCSFPVPAHVPIVSCARAVDAQCAPKRRTPPQWDLFPGVPLLFHRH